MILCSRFSWPIGVGACKLVINVMQEVALTQHNLDPKERGGPLLWNVWGRLGKVFWTLEQEWVLSWAKSFLMCAGMFLLHLAPSVEGC